MTPVFNWILLGHSYDHIICNGQRKDYILTLICISCCTDGLVVWHLFFLILCWIYKTLKTLKMSGICSIMCHVINHANIWIHFDLLLMWSSPIMPKHTCLLFQIPHQSPGLPYGSPNLKISAFLCIIYFKFITFSPKFEFSLKHSSVWFWSRVGKGVFHEPWTPIFNCHESWTKDFFFIIGQQM